jgi:beta-glucosidase/6-phospho-beta-glucosidase/beta-galactosidase
MLDEMEALGLEPNATLHHFTHPTWFEDLGGFMNEENIPLFVEWSVFMYKEFGKRIRLWATFNEPTVSLWSGVFFNMHVWACRGVPVCLLLIPCIVGD